MSWQVIVARNVIVKRRTTAWIHYILSWMRNKLNGYSNCVSFGFVYLTWLFNLHPCFLFTTNMEIWYESNPELPKISPFYISFQSGLLKHSAFLPIDHIEEPVFLRHFAFQNLVKVSFHINFCKLKWSIGFNLLIF